MSNPFILLQSKSWYLLQLIYIQCSKATAKLLKYFYSTTLLPSCLWKQSIVNMILKACGGNFTLILCILSTYKQSQFTTSSVISCKQESSLWGQTVLHNISNVCFTKIGCNTSHILHKANKQMVNDDSSHIPLLAMDGNDITKEYLHMTGH